MLLGCTVTVMHWLMLPANRYGSSARSQLSLGEHLPHRSTHQSTGRCQTAQGATAEMSVKGGQSQGKGGCQHDRGVALQWDQVSG